MPLEREALTQLQQRSQKNRCKDAQDDDLVLDDDEDNDNGEDDFEEKDSDHL